MSDKKAPKKAGKKPAKKTGKTTTKKIVVEKGSLIYVDYVGRTKKDGLVFDLTLEEVAKKEGLYKENSRYAPMLVAVGWNWLLAALEEELVGMKVNETKKIEIPPEKGAGLRDPNKIKVIAKAKLAKQGVRPIKGEQVTFGNEKGIISTVLGRTVRVDFNSPLAGQTLVFDVTVKEIVSGRDEKLQAIVLRRIPTLPKEKIIISVKNKVITIELPLETRYIENIQYAEIGISMDALKVVEDAKAVRIVVTYERPDPLKENMT